MNYTITTQSKKVYDIVCDALSAYHEHQDNALDIAQFTSVLEQLEDTAFSRTAADKATQVLLKNLFTAPKGIRVLRCASIQVKTIREFLTKQTPKTVLKDSEKTYKVYEFPSGLGFPAIEYAPKDPRLTQSWTTNERVAQRFMAERTDLDWYGPDDLRDSVWSKEVRTDPKRKAALFAKLPETVCCLNEMKDSERVGIIYATKIDNTFLINPTAFRGNTFSVFYESTPEDSENEKYNFGGYEESEILRNGEHPVMCTGLLDKAITDFLIVSDNA